MNNEDVLEEIANLGECSCPRLYKIVDTKKIGKGTSCKKHGFLQVSHLNVSMLGTQELEFNITLRVIPNA